MAFTSHRAAHYKDLMSVQFYVVVNTYIQASGLLRVVNCSPVLLSMSYD